MIIPSCDRPALLRASTSCSINSNSAGNERHCARSSLRVTPCRTGTETSACYGNNRAVKHGCCAGRDVPQMSELTPAAPSDQGSTPYKATFYKRALPTPPCIDFASEEGKLIMLEAMQAGHMTGFFKLVQHLATQGEPAFCGIASLCVVFNALEIDPRRVWKGAWRWFSEDMLDCCKPLDQIQKDGLTLDQVLCIAYCNCSSPEAFRHGEGTCGHFRSAVAAATASGDEHIIATYSRKVLNQTGDGHFSPIGGYHPGRDLVLILDTARFKYPLHWVPLELLYDAMAPCDSATGLPRGYLKIARSERPCLLLYTLSIKCGWRPAHIYAMHGCVTAAHDALFKLTSPTHSTASQGNNIKTATDENRILEAAQNVLEEIVLRMPLASTACIVQPRDLTVACNHSMTQAQIQAKHEMYQIPMFSVVERTVENLAEARPDLIGSIHDFSQDCKNFNYNFEEKGNILEEIQGFGAKDSKAANMHASSTCTEGSSESSPCPSKVKLLAEQCFMMLCLCKPALEEACQKLLDDSKEPSLEAFVEDSASRVSRISISQESESSEGSGAHACNSGAQESNETTTATAPAKPPQPDATTRTLRAVLDMFAQVEESSLVAAEVKSLAEQLASLLLLDSDAKTPTAEAAAAAAAAGTLPFKHTPVPDNRCTSCT